MTLKEQAEEFGMHIFPGESKRMFQTRIENVLAARKKHQGETTWRKTHKGVERTDP